MRTETALAATAGGLLLVALAVPVALPGVLAESDPGPVREGHLSISEVTVRTTDVGGESATLGVETALEKAGGPVENATVRLRATDADSGLVVETATVPAGDLEGTKEVRLDGALTLEREGAYRIEALLYVDGARTESAGKSVSGFEHLRPAYERSPVAFRSFESDLPTIEYAIADAGPDRVDLDVTAYLLNRGADAAEGYRLTLTARQSASNIVADRASVDVAALASGGTGPVDATLSVPDEYNYYLDAVLWRDGVVLDTARSAANLRPNETLEVDRSEEGGGLEVSDFASEDDGRDRGPGTTDAAGDGGGGGSIPGFGPVVALLAIAVGAGLTWRTTDE